MIRRGILAAGVAVCAAIPPAQAQDISAPRCTILGQMAVSSWLQILSGLPNAKANALDPIIARFDHLSSSYATLSCDPEALQSAMDCLVTQSGTKGSQTLARTCMAEAGLTSAD